LVRDEGTQEFVETAATVYTARTGLTPRVYVCAATDGAEIVVR
jgi:galactokinase